MQIQPIVISTLWAGLFAVSLAILVTIPPKHLVNSFICGATGRFTCDMLAAQGVRQSAATAIGAIVIVLVAVFVQRGKVASPALVVCAVLPLGAAVSMLNAMWHLLTLASLEGTALNKALEVLSVDFGEVCITSLSIAAGLAVGMAIVRILRRERLWGEV